MTQTVHSAHIAGIGISICFDLAEHSEQVKRNVHINNEK